MKQTFIIKINFDRKNLENDRLRDFFRVGCKRKETALKYLKNWKRDAKEKGYEYLYPFFFDAESEYEIVSTPDGYNERETVLKGFIKDL